MYMSDYVDQGHDKHQEADFAMDASERRMVLSYYPLYCGCDTRYGCQQEYPP